MRAYGQELILDLYGCNPALFTRASLDKFFAGMCNEIGMQRCERYWWDDLHTPEGERQTSPHTKGTSAVQFILTSNITIHTLDEVGEVYINIFSCRAFDEHVAAVFAAAHFDPHRMDKTSVVRGMGSKAHT